MDSEKTEVKGGQEELKKDEGLDMRIIERNSDPRAKNFDLSKHYDMNNYTDRFRFHFGRFNPALSFLPNERVM